MGEQSQGIWGKLLRKWAIWHIRRTYPGGRFGIYVSPTKRNAGNPRGQWRLSADSTGRTTKTGQCA